jgi:hypothetical protein
MKASANEGIRTNFNDWISWLENLGHKINEDVGFYRCSYIAEQCNTVNIHKIPRNWLLRMDIAVEIPSLLPDLNYFKRIG